MTETLSWRDVPAMQGNRLFLDYVDAEPRARAHYTHGPTGYAEGLASRRGYPYPRAAVADLLEAYNRPLGASAQTMAAIASLREPDTYCVVGGQQAGFMGGPAYVAYKMTCTVALARALSRGLGVRVVPVFWLASEDHDFGDVNHTHYAQADGEVGRVSFDWNAKGRPVADLPLSGEVMAAVEAYWAAVPPGAHTEAVRALTSPRGGRYCDWLASMWLSLYAADGLIVVEPHVLRPAAGPLFEAMARQQAAVQERLAAVAGALERDGYTPLLSPETAGVMYTFGADGRRVRVQDPEDTARVAAAHPERFSTDAALRPLLADSLLPVLASTLGAGELAYQGMLRPLYGLFGIPQPLCYPRKSYTIVSERERERLDAYGLSPRDLLTGELDIDATMKRLMPAGDTGRFSDARAGIESALAPLKAYVEGLDPNMGRSWEQALTTALRNIDKLEERAINVTLSRSGYARRELQSLRNALLPRGRLQERVFPFTHFALRHGTGFLDRLAESDLERFGHEIVTLENGDG